MFLSRTKGELTKLRELWVLKYSWIEEIFESFSDFASSSSPFPIPLHSPFRLDVFSWSALVCGSSHPFSAPFPIECALALRYCGYLLPVLITKICQAWTGSSKFWGAFRIRKPLKYFIDLWIIEDVMIGVRLLKRRRSNSDLSGVHGHGLFSVPSLIIANLSRNFSRKILDEQYHEIDKQSASRNSAKKGGGSCCG
jgi:hypothetical protein